MSRVRNTWALTALMVAMLLLVPFLAACGGGDDDDDATATTEQTTDSAATTAEQEESGGDATEEATDDSTDEPTTTLEALTDLLENPFSDTITFSDAELENFTVEFTGDFHNDLTGTQPIDLFVEQSSSENYHMRVSGFGLDEGFEVWMVDGATHVGGPGGLTFELPSIGDATIGTPGDFLIEIPDINTISGARDVGQEEIDGRSTTHYEVEPSEIGEFTDGAEFNDATGTIDVWIDDELNIVVMMDVDVEWTDQNGDQQQADYVYSLTRIDSTPEIQAP